MYRSVFYCLPFLFIVSLSWSGETEDIYLSKIKSLAFQAKTVRATISAAKAGCDAEKWNCEAHMSINDMKRMRGEYISREDRENGSRCKEKYTKGMEDVDGLTEKFHQIGRRLDDLKLDMSKYYQGNTPSALKTELESANEVYKAEGEKI